MTLPVGNFEFATRSYAVASMAPAGSKLLVAIATENHNRCARRPDTHEKSTCRKNDLMRKKGDDPIRPTYRNHPGARDALRRATQDIHERLHGHIVFRRLLDRSITRAEYRALLARLYGFHRPLETALSAHADVRPDLEMGRRRRAHLLVADLKALGLGDADIAVLPFAAMPSRLMTQAGSSAAFTSARVL